MREALLVRIWQVDPPPRCRKGRIVKVVRWRMRGGEGNEADERLYPTGGEERGGGGAD